MAAMMKAAMNRPRVTENRLGMGTRRMAREMIRKRHEDVVGGVDRVPLRRPNPPREQQHLGRQSERLTIVTKLPQDPQRVVVLAEGAKGPRRVERIGPWIPVRRRRIGQRIRGLQAL